MRAIVTRNRPDMVREKALVTDWPEPEPPTANQFQTRTIYTGMTNGTERNQLTRGNYAPADDRLPRPHGYQNVGRVIAVGSEVTQVQVGNAVFMAAPHVEYVVMPLDGGPSKLPWVKLAENVDLQQAAFLGLASIATHSCRHAEIRLGEKVLVVGAGCVGQFAAQIATLMGARVTLCDIDQPRLEVARQIGAAEKVADTSGAGWETHIPDATFDVILDLAGVPGMEDQLIRSAKMRGRVLFVAGRSQVSYTFNTGQGREITIRQNSSFTQSDLTDTCHLLAKGSLQVAPVIRDVIPAEAAGPVYDTLRDNPNKLYGTLFNWQT